MRQPDEDFVGHSRYTEASLDECTPARRVRMLRLDAHEAKGPAYARSLQPALLGGGSSLEDFCLQIDAHTVFQPDWEDRIILDWAKTDNEYAVLSSYPPGTNQLNKDGTVASQNNHWEMPHMCDVIPGKPGQFRGSVAGAAANLQHPVLSKFWAAGLSFSKCHAEREVPQDPGLKNIFHGEEFARGMRLWTNGYDLYSMSRPVLLTYYGDDKGEKGSWDVDQNEQKQTLNRLATLVRYKQANRSAKALEALRGYDVGTRRTLAQYSALTGVDTINNEYHRTPCPVLHWTPWQPDAQPPYQVLENSPVKLGTSVNGLIKALNVTTFALRGAKALGLLPLSELDLPHEL